jgi:hypothetical protein
MDHQMAYYNLKAKDWGEWKSDITVYFVNQNLFGIPFGITVSIMMEVLKKNISSCHLSLATH